MTQADSVHSTPPSNTSANNIAAPSRRGFLAQAAVVAAGGAALGTALPLPQSANALPGLPDPILAAIEAHHRAAAALNQTYKNYAGLEESLPKELRQTSISVWEENIVETDAPEWIAREREAMAGHNAEEDAALKLCCIEPTTIAGVEALLAFTVQSPDKYGSQFPEFEDDEGTVRPFEHFIIQHCAAALAKVSSVA